MPLCSTNNANLDKTNFEIIFKFEKFGVKSGFPFMQLNRATYSKLRKSNFDMFHKNYCWAVICYPICMTNMSYERGIILLSFSDISFVILVFVFQRFERRFFFLLTRYMSSIKIAIFFFFFFFLQLGLVLLMFKSEDMGVTSAEIFEGITSIYYPLIPSITWLSLNFNNNCECNKSYKLS